jgi:hypothetical protein
MKRRRQDREEGRTEADRTALNNRSRSPLWDGHSSRSEGLLSPNVVSTDVAMANAPLRALGWFRRKTGVLFNSATSANSSGSFSRLGGDVDDENVRTGVSLT